MPHHMYLESFRKELEFLSSIASLTGSVDAVLVKEQLVGAGAPALIFAHARDSGATEDDMRSFLLSLRETKSGDQPLLTLDAVKYLQSELWQVNTSIARQHGSGVQSVARVQGVGTGQDHERSTSSEQLYGHHTAHLPEEEQAPQEAPGTEFQEPSGRVLASNSQPPAPNSLSCRFPFTHQQTPAVECQQQDAAQTDSFQVPQPPSRLRKPLDAIAESPEAAPASNNPHTVSNTPQADHATDSRYPTSSATKIEASECPHDGDGTAAAAFFTPSLPLPPQEGTAMQGQDEAAEVEQAALHPNVLCPQQDSNCAASTQYLPSTDAPSSPNLPAQPIVIDDDVDGPCTLKSEAIHPEFQPPQNVHLSPATPYTHTPATRLSPFPPMHAPPMHAAQQLPCAVPEECPSHSPSKSNDFLKDPAIDAQAEETVVEEESHELPSTPEATNPQSHACHAHAHAFQLSPPGGVSSATEEVPNNAMHITAPAGSMDPSGTIQSLQTPVPGPAKGKRFPERFRGSSGVVRREIHTVKPVNAAIPCSTAHGQEGGGGGYSGTPPVANLPKRNLVNTPVPLQHPVQLNRQSFPAEPFGPVSVHDLKKFPPNVRSCGDLLDARAQNLLSQLPAVTKETSRHALGVHCMLRRAGSGVLKMPSSGAARSEIHSVNSRYEIHDAPVSVAIPFSKARGKEGDGDGGGAPPVPNCLKNQLVNTPVRLRHPVTENSNLNSKGSNLKLQAPCCARISPARRIRIKSKSRESAKATLSAAARNDTEEPSNINNKLKARTAVASSSKRKRKDAKHVPATQLCGTAQNEGGLKTKTAPIQAKSRRTLKLSELPQIDTSVKHVPCMNSRAQQLLKSSRRWIH